jgi:hypothetical protein
MAGAGRDILAEFSLGATDPTLNRWVPLACASHSGVDMTLHQTLKPLPSMCPPACVQIITSILLQQW